MIFLEESESDPMPTTSAKNATAPARKAPAKPRPALVDEAWWELARVAWVGLPGRSLTVHSKGQPRGSLAVHETQKGRAGLPPPFLHSEF